MTDDNDPNIDYFKRGIILCGAMFILMIIFEVWVHYYINTLIGV